MQKSKTQSSVQALSGLQGVFNLEQLPSSPSFPKDQRSRLCGYRIDGQLLVEPVWRLHHG